jgi:hypothetical protein
MHAVELDDRFQRVELFLGYLEQHEQQELLQFSNAQHAKVFGPFVPRIRAVFLKEKLDIGKRVKKSKFYDRRASAPNLPKS